MKAEKITINACVNALLSQTWNLYTAPQHIVNWNFASDDWHCPKAENDLQIGGKYLARMEAKNGSFGFDFEAVYSDVNAPHNFKYALPDGRVVAVNFTEKEGKTEVTVIFDAELENPLDMQRQGWQAILNNFKKYAESRQ